MLPISKVYKLLTLRERRQAFSLLILMVAGMLLETLGIGLIIPAVALMTQAGMHGSWGELSQYIGLTSRYPQATLIAAAVLMLLLVYLVKNLFLVYMLWRQTQFAFDVQASLSSKLFSRYLRQPYTFHLQKNSAQLIRNVVSEVSLFRGILSGAMQLLSEMLVLAGIAILLLVIEPVGSLAVVLFFLILVWGFHLLTHGKLARWGEARQYHDGWRVQHLQQGLGGIKDIKLLGREGNFLAQYDTHNRESARAWKMQTLMQNFPRLLFELLGVSGLVVLVLGMLAQGRDAATILPTLGLFAAAAFRLLPSVNRILASMQAMRGGDSVINMLCMELSAQEAGAPAQAGQKMHFSALSLRDVSFCYPGQTRVALENISLNLRHGESIGLIGASGSGKSTLVDITLGLLAPSSGLIELNGVDVHNNLRQWQDMIGYVPQNIFLTDDTLRRNIAFGLADEKIDGAAIQRALKAAQLDEFVAQLPQGLDTMVGERGVRLSGGQRQRIGIARALYHDPEVLVLDEATSALDETTERGVMQAVAALKGNKTLLVVAHRLTTIAHCDRFVRMEQGKVVQQGKVSELSS